MSVLTQWGATLVIQIREKTKKREREKDTERDRQTDTGSGAIVLLLLLRALFILVWNRGLYNASVGSAATRSLSAATASSQGSHPKAARCFQCDAAQAQVPFTHHASGPRSTQ